MSTFSVKVRKIEILPHSNADALELAKVDDYRCVVKKGQYKTGDLVVYIPEAAIVPEWILKQYNFWNEKENKGMLAGSEGNRVKAIKLRGELSTGIVIPVITEFPNGLPYGKGFIRNLIGEELFLNEGDDVSEFLGITKWSPPIPVHMAGEVFNAGSHLTVNYDIENIKAYPTVLQEDEEVVITEKLHGCADYDTLIDTIEFGSIKIGDLVRHKLNCHVKSFDIKNNEIVYEQIEGYSELPNDIQWYEIELDNGEKMKLTGNHLVWLPESACYKQVDKLNEEDVVLVDNSKKINVIGNHSILLSDHKHYRHIVESYEEDMMPVDNGY